MPGRSVLVLYPAFCGRQQCHQFIHAFTLLSVPSGNNPRSETPHAFGIPVVSTPHAFVSRVQRTPSEFQIAVRGIGMGIF